MEVYAEYGAIGVIVSLFVMLILNLIKSQRAQTKYINDIVLHIAKVEGLCTNMHGILLKVLDRWTRSDETSLRHREDIIKELNDVTDDLSFLKGRINGGTRG